MGLTIARLLRRIKSFSSLISLFIRDFCRATTQTVNGERFLHRKTSARNINERNKASFVESENQGWGESKDFLPDRTTTVHVRAYFNYDDRLKISEEKNSRSEGRGMNSV